MSTNSATLRITALPIPGIQQMISFVDKVIFATLFIAIALPFRELIRIPIGAATISGFEFVYLISTFFLLLRILLTGKIQAPKTAAVTFGTFAAYVIGSSVIAHVNLGDAVRQSRYYWPFLLAVLLLCTGTRIGLRKFFQYIIVAATMSSTSALILHHFFKSYLKHAFANSPETWDTIQTGRMAWDNAMLVFFVVLLFAVRHCSLRINRIMAVVSLIVTSAALFNTFNRTMLAGVAAYLVGSVFFLKGWREALYGLGRLLAISTVLAAVIAMVTLADSRARELVFARYMGSGGGAERIYETDVEMSRFGLYIQYWDSARTHFPWGQGFGRPFAFYNGQPDPVADISIVSFYLPFGVFGLILFGAFIRCLWGMVEKHREKLPAGYPRAIKLLIVISIIVSMNIDIYSRNNFVILLVLFILCCRNGVKATPHPTLPATIPLFPVPKAE